MTRRSSKLLEPGSLLAVPGFNERIREARRRARLTQEQLAERIGLSRPTLTKYEKGEGFAPPTIADIERIATATGADPAWLAFGDEREVKATAGGAEAKLGRVVQRDDSMSPRFPAGTRFLFDHDATTHPGDLVAVRLADEQVAVRVLRDRLNAEDQRAVELRPLNADFASEIIKPSDLADRLLGRVVEARLTV